MQILINISAARDRCLVASGESQNHKIVCLAVGLFARTVHCALWVPKLDTIFVGVRFHLTAAEPAWATLGVVLGLPVSQFPFRSVTLQNLHTAVQ